jgi:translation initiation factor IF-1
MSGCGVAADVRSAGGGWAAARGCATLGSRRPTPTHAARHERDAIELTQELARPTECDSRNGLARDDLIQIQGTISEALAGGNYRVKGDNGMDFLAKIGGRMRRYHIRVIPGDRVTIAVSPYDPTHGLIVFRGR